MTTQRFTMNHFDDFLSLAQQQTEPQRLLLVVAKRELPQGYTHGQQEAFQRGEGGHLAPLAGADKAPAEVASFTALKSEIDTLADTWDAIFVAALPYATSTPPSTSDLDKAIDRMIQAIRDGRISQYLVFDPQGEPLILETA